MSRFMESVLKIIERAQKNWFFWLVIAICCLPLGFVFGSKYFSISGSFAAILTIVLIMNFSKFIKNKKQDEYEILCDLYSMFKKLWPDERFLLIELFLNKTAERRVNNFYIEGSGGLRSEQFYQLTGYDEVPFGCEKNAKIKFQWRNKENESYYYFIIDEDFRLYYYKYFQKLYKQNKNIVNE